MSPATEHDHTRQLELLRAAYQARLAQRAGEITTLWRRTRSEPSSATRAALQLAAHQLAGSGGTYGLVNLSHAAHQLDVALRPTIASSGALPRDAQAQIDLLVAALLDQLQSRAPSAGDASFNAVDMPRGDAGGDPLRVLLVDDDDDILVLLREQLRGAGYHVSCARSGEEAIEHIEANPADLAIVDVLLPGISGLQTLELMREYAPDMAVILTTSHGSENIAIDALRRGATDYLRKPLDPRDQRAVLARAIEMLSLRRQNRQLQAELAEKHRRLETELARAARVQADLLPHELPDVPGFVIAARCIPAREVGGDFYDWQIPGPGVLNLTFGDVMGKGMPAALLMTSVRAVMRSIQRATPPAINVRYATSILEPDLDRANSFVTLFHAQLDTQSGAITYVDAGHGCAFILRADGSATAELGPRFAPVGVPQTEEITQGRAELGPGDALVIFSDGLLDARPELLGSGHQTIAGHIGHARSAQEILERTIALADLSGPPPDDLTVLVLYRSA